MRKNTQPCSDLSLHPCPVLQYWFPTPFRQSKLLPCHACLPTQSFSLLQNTPLVTMQRGPAQITYSSSSIIETGSKDTRAKKRKSNETNGRPHSSSWEPHLPACHILTERTVMPRLSPWPQVGSHSLAAFQKVHCALVEPSIQGLRSTWSLGGC
jgi:hypothetical protein